MVVVLTADDLAVVVVVAAVRGADVGVIELDGGEERLVVVVAAAVVVVVSATVVGLVVRSVVEVEVEVPGPRICARAGSAGHMAVTSTTTTAATTTGAALPAAVEHRWCTPTSGIVGGGAYRWWKGHDHVVRPPTVRRSSGVPSRGQHPPLRRSACRVPV